jgi:Amiloride-sensitive sodium channel
VFLLTFSKTKSFSGIKTAKICTLDEMSCIHKVEKALVDEDGLSFKSCGCLSDCNIVEYDYEVRQDNIVQDNSVQSLKASVSVYFAEEEYIVYRRYATHGKVIFLSNIGGLLGLFLGMSVLSLVETIYFFTLRLFDDLWYKG